MDTQNTEPEPSEESVLEAAEMAAMEAQELAAEERALNERKAASRAVALAAGVTPENLAKISHRKVQALGDDMLMKALPAAIGGQVVSFRLVNARAAVAATDSTPASGVPPWAAVDKHWELLPMSKPGQIAGRPFRVSSNIGKTAFQPVKATDLIDAGISLLTKEYLGSTFVVEVTPMGFVYEGQTFTSLNPIAQLITQQSSINAPKWFGLRD